jgi:sugar phosphate isomerase/epimerase
MAWALSAFADECAPGCDGQVAALVRAGITRVDVRSVDGVNVSALPLDHAKRVRAALDAAGVSCAMLASPIGKVDVAEPVEGDLDKLKHLAEVGRVLNCRAVRIFSYFNARGWAREAWREESLRRLGALKELAKGLNLVLYHENESNIFGDRGEDVLTIARELRDGETFRTIFDFGNFTAGRENAWDNWVKLREFTDGFHLKDSVWGTVDGEAKVMHVPAGQGSGCVREVLADAVKRRFSGPVSVEPHLVHSPAVMATGPTGVSNRAYAGLSAGACFEIACAAGKEVLVAAGAVVE